MRGSPECWFCRAACCCSAAAVTLRPLLPPCLPCRSFGNAHTYHINSIALSSDCETFISADDLRVNLWHLDRCAGAVWLLFQCASWLLRWHG